MRPTDGRVFPSFQHWDIWMIKEKIFYVYEMMFNCHSENLLFSYKWKTAERSEKSLFSNQGEK